MAALPIVPTAAITRHHPRVVIGVEAEVEARVGTCEGVGHRGIRTPSRFSCSYS